MTGVSGPGASESAASTRLANLLRGPRFLTALVLLGAALRTWAYLANTPLWLDEILLSRNILELPLRALLTEPLRLDQVAPRGFLLVERLAVLVGGPNPLVLRLLPFLCGIAGLILFRRLAERTLSGLAVPFALALFAMGIPLIKYSAEVKQYEIDATVAILLALLALDLQDREATPRRLVAVGLVGFGLVWFSQAAVFVMGGIGLALGLQWLAGRSPRTGRVLLFTMPIWGLAALAAVLTGRRSMTPSTQEFMDLFWRQGFLPRPFIAPAALRWFPDQAMSAFSDQTMLRYQWPELFLVVAIIGTVALWRSRRQLAAFILGPLVLALVAAAAHQYPFRGRLMLYLIPGLLLAIAAGAECLRQLGSRVHPALGSALMLALIGPPMGALLAAPPPYDLEHIPSVLGYLQTHRQPGDVIYVFPLHRIGFLFYGPRFGVNPGEWTTAACDRAEVAVFIRDVDRYRGNPRLWMISTEVRPFLTARNAVRDYLGTIGIKRDSLSYPSLNWVATTLDLYDLSDTVRLQAATAQSFQVPAMPSFPRPSCRPWQMPSSLDEQL